MAEPPAWGFSDRTAAFLVAGKSIGHTVHVLTYEAIERLAALAPRVTGGVATVVPGGDLRPEVRSEDGRAFVRIVVGSVAAVALAEAGRPHGPIGIADLRDAVTASSSLPMELWDAVAKELEATEAIHNAATFRRYDEAGYLKGVALDAHEVRTEPCGLHLLAAGPLPAGELVFGVAYDPKLPDDGDERLDSPEWDKLKEGYCEGGLRYFAGQDESQTPHAIWVKGISVANANFAGLGSQRVILDTAAHDERRAALAGHDGAAYWLIPYYD